jgi:hypothetical protein
LVAALAMFKDVVEVTEFGEHKASARVLQPVDEGSVTKVVHSLRNVANLLRKPITVSFPGKEGVLEVLPGPGSSRDALVAQLGPLAPAPPPKVTLHDVSSVMPETGAPASPHTPGARELRFLGFMKDVLQVTEFGEHDTSVKVLQPVEKASALKTARSLINVANLLRKPVKVTLPGNEAALEVLPRSNVNVVGEHLLAR